MPRKYLKKLSIKQIEELETKYPLWLVDLGVQFNKAELIHRNGSNFKAKLRARDPEEYARRQREYQFNRKLREAGVIPKFRPKGSYHVST